MFTKQITYIYRVLTFLSHYNMVNFPFLLGDQGQINSEQTKFFY